MLWYNFKETNHFSKRQKVLVISKKEILLKEIEQVPEPFLDEVLDFIRFLKTRNANKRMNITIASESSLAKDWLKPEEDEAWQNLQEVGDCLQLQLWSTSKN